MVSNKNEIPFDSKSLERLFSCLNEQEILVGGQALIYWIGQYGLTVNNLAFTKDADILAPADSVAHLSSELNGKALYPPKKGFGTALYGQVLIDVSNSEYLNIDVLRVLLGTDNQGVVNRAIKTEDNFLIMNPIDLLISKVTNFVKISEKQDDNGKIQALLSIDLIHKFTEEMVAKEQIDDALKVVNTIFHLGKSNLVLSQFNHDG